MWVWTLVALVMALGESAWGAPPSDRLEQFRDVAQRYAAALEQDTDGSGLSELWRIVDAEVADNLRSGEPFSSTAFIQSRLDAFSDEWGGASFTVTAPFGAPTRAPIVGRFTLTHGEPRSSLRIYDRTGALLASATHIGHLDIRPWPSALSARQLLATWVGPQTGTDARALTLELWGLRPDASPIRLWSSDAAFPSGLRATGFSARGGRLVVRQEVTYPGWKSGCADQTEEETVYQSSRSSGLLAPRRQVVNGWHRELQAVVARFFAALDSGDRRTLAELVSNPSLRARLPADLRPDSVCDERRSASPATVIVAATREHDGHRVPWSLTWRREPRGWRLTAAGPMLE